MQFSRHGYAIAILMSVLAVGTFATSSTHLAHGLPTQNVDIVNTTSQPIPTVVQGTTNVSGTVSLSSGTSVNIVQDANNPLPVRNVDVHGRTCVTLGNSLGLSNKGEDYDSFYTVPAGKQLV